MQQIYYNFYIYAIYIVKIYNLFLYINDRYIHISNFAIIKRLFKDSFL